MHLPIKRDLVAGPGVGFRAAEYEDHNKEIVKMSIWKHKSAGMMAGVGWSGGKFCAA